MFTSFKLVSRLHSKLPDSCELSALYINSYKYTFEHVSTPIDFENYFKKYFTANSYEAK